MINEIKKAVQSMLDEDEDYRQHCVMMRGTEEATIYIPNWDHTMLHTVLEIIRRVERQCSKTASNQNQAE